MPSAVPRAAFALSLLCLGPSGQAAQPATQAAGDPVRVTSLDNGRFRLKSGETQRVLDLRPALGGCWASRYDGMTGERLGGDVSARVLDLRHKAGFWYLVMQVNTGSNCNIQGQCGAAQNSDVLWLKLSSSLRLAARQGVPVVSCQTDTELTRFRGRTAEGQAPTLDLAGGILDLAYRSQDFIAGTSVTRTLRYDRRTPERGLVVHVGRPVRLP